MPSASYQRLFDALREHADEPPKGPTDVGRLMGGETPATVGNWKNRDGVSVDAAVYAQRKYGISATWILHGEGDVLISTRKSQAGRPSDATMDKTVDILNVLAAARPNDNALNPLNWETIRKVASVVEKSNAEDRRQLFAEVLACIQKG